MNEIDIKDQLIPLLGQWSWLIIIAIIFLVFRQAIENLVASIIFFLGRNYNVDDVILIEDKLHRVIRVGLFSTIFFCYTVRNHTIVRETKITIPNTKLKDLKIEKPLPDLRIEELLYINSDNGVKEEKK